MNIMIHIMIFAVIGAAVGLAHFGILWLTVCRVPLSRHPGRLLLGGGLLRFILFVCGFAAAAIYGGITGALSSLASFLLVRTFIVNRVRRSCAAAAGTKDRA